MPSRPLRCLCHNYSTFTADGEFDEDAYRQSVQRSVDSGIGVSVASGGGGESHTMSLDELGRLYRAAVAVAKGKVAVESNQPSQHTWQLTVEHARVAIAAGIEVVSLYGPSGLHGYRATDEEFGHYFDRVLAEIDHPVMLNPNPLIATASPATVARICDRHPQVVSVAIAGHPGDAYFVQLMDALGRDVDVYVPIVGSMNCFGLGAAGLMVGTSNVLPKTVRRYLDCCQRGDLAAAGAAYAQLRRFDLFGRQWSAAWPRAYKMAATVLKLPGWQGGLREPYLPAPESELTRFRDGLLALRIPEIDELASAAGLSVPGLTA